MKTALALCLVLAACTDPRARPAPPIVQVSVSPTFILTSPGPILASLYSFDEDGLDVLDLSVKVFGGVYNGDSTILLDGLTEQTRPINWQLPAHIIVGTPVTLISKVTDFAGFATTDTLFLTVQDSI